MSDLSGNESDYGFDAEKYIFMNKKSGIEIPIPANFVIDVKMDAFIDISTGEKFPIPGSLLTQVKEAYREENLKAYSPFLTLTVARIYQKQGLIGAAKAVCNNLLEFNSNNVEAVRMLEELDH